MSAFGSQLAGIAAFARPFRLGAGRGLGDLAGKGLRWAA